MNDPADDTAIINPWFATCVARKMRLKPCKLLLTKPDRISIQQSSPFGDLESRHFPIRESGGFCEVAAR